MTLNDQTPDRPQTVGAGGGTGDWRSWSGLRSQASIALQVNAVPFSDTIDASFPRQATMAVSSRATRRPEIEVSRIALRHPQ